MNALSHTCKHGHFDCAIVEGGACSDEQRRVAAENIERGTVFDTTFESGCIARTNPDRDGNFIALDSDGIDCRFNVTMVTRVAG